MVATQELRGRGAVIVNPWLQERLAPGAGAEAKICFETFDDQAVDVLMVGRRGRVARTLATEVVLPRPRCYRWDGDDDSGRPVAPGPYRLRVVAPEADRVATTSERVMILPGGGAGK